MGVIELRVTHPAAVGANYISWCFGHPFFTISDILCLVFFFQTRILYYIRGLLWGRHRRVSIRLVYIIHDLLALGTRLDFNPLSFSV